MSESIFDLTQEMDKLRMGHNRLSDELTIGNAYFAVDINQIRNNIACLPQIQQLLTRIDAWLKNIERNHLDINRWENNHWEEPNFWTQHNPGPHNVGIKIFILKYDAKDATKNIHGLASVCGQCVCSQAYDRSAQGDTSGCQFAWVCIYLMDNCNDNLSARIWIQSKHG